MIFYFFVNEKTQGNTQGILSRSERGNPEKANCDVDYILGRHFYFQSGGGETTTNASIPRPSEIFYNKLTPILKDLYKDKLDQVDLMNRKLWPTTTLLQVLSELLRETPKDLLAR